MPRRKPRSSKKVSNLRKVSKKVSKIDSFVSNLRFLYCGAKREIWLLSAIFLLGMFLPPFLPVEQKADALSAFSDKTDVFSQIPEELLLLLLPLGLFLNNTYVSIISFILGPLSPYFMFNNGFIVGTLFDALGRMSLAIPEVALLPFLSVLPHGWIEIPAFIIAASYGLRIWEKIAFPSRIEPKLSRLNFIFKYIEPLFKAVVPMLIAAALIESYISAPLGALLLIEPVEKSSDIKNLLLTETELESFGFAQSKSGAPSLFEDIRPVYSESFPEVLKITSKSQRSSVFYSSKTTNSTLLITVVKTNDSERLVSLQRNIALYRLSFDKNHTLQDLQTYSVAKTQDKLYYFSFTAQGDYAVLITSWAPRELDFPKIIELQREKIPT